MSDLISRADAIDTVEELNRKVNDGRESDTICTSDVLRRINALPSAETPTVSEKHQLSEETPTNTPTNTPTDLISRQVAIDALGEEPEIWNDTEEEWAYRNAWVEHISAIKSLPSADRPTVDKEYLINLIQGAVYDGEACEKLIDLVDRPTGECRTCGRNADNGGVHEDGRTKCPIQEHYALLLDGYCHLYEPYDCGAKMYKGGDDE